MLTGDSEPPLFSRPSLREAASPAAINKSSQLQPDLQSASSKHCSVSFSSDSAHVPVPQAPVAPNTPAQNHSRMSAASPQRIPTISPIALPNGIPAQAPAPPTSSRSHSHTLQAQDKPSGRQAVWQSAGQGTTEYATQAPYQPSSQPTHGNASRSSSFSSSLTEAQQPSSAATSQVGSAASLAPGSSAQVWRSNPAYGVPPTHAPTPANERTPSSHRASQSLPSFKAFTSVDRRLTDSWRAKLLEDLADESDSEQSTDLRITLPVVSEHDSLPALTQQWGLQSSEQTQDLLSSAAQTHTHTPAQNDHSGTALLAPHAHPFDAASFPDEATSFPSHSHMAQASLSDHQIYPSDMPMSGDSSHHHSQQHDQADRAQALYPQQADMTHAEAAADDFGTRRAHSMLPPAMATINLLSDSNLEVVKARSNMLDIPSAELLDSILDFANAVCGEQQNDGAYSPLKVITTLVICFTCCFPLYMLQAACTL